MARRRTVAVAVVGLALAACGSDGGGADRGQDGAITIRAGVNDSQDPNIAVLEFLPASVTVGTGTEVTWTWTGAEPHSVTFFPAGQQPPTPDKAGRYFQGTDEGTVNGTAVVNSGLRPVGPEPPADFRATFPQAGAYDYVCVIHPLMTGTVTVVDSGEVDSASEVTERGDGEMAQYLTEGRAAKKQLVEKPPRKEAGGGRTTWYVEMGATTEHTDILAFAPTPAKVTPGDRVVFVNNSGAPHTASFGGDKVPRNPESTEAMRPTGKQPLRLNATDYINTGWLPPNAPPGQGPPESARSYTVSVPEAGTYSYVCILHVPSGMVGTIEAS